VQINAIRPRIDPRQFITTNIGGLGWSDHFDHCRICDPLTLAAWDDYVGEGHLDAARNAAMHDFVRGWKRRNFLVMETQPGFVNWARVNNSLDKGETRAMAWQAIGHGAEGVLYWQWRDALNGQEQYHGAIVGPDRTPLTIYPEIQQTATEFNRAQAALAGTAPVSDVAIVLTYDSRWALDFQPHTARYDQLDALLDFYRPLAQIA
jgi:beta-galactosidase